MIKVSHSKILMSMMIKILIKKLFYFVLIGLTKTLVSTVGAS